MKTVAQESAEFAKAQAQHNKAKAMTRAQMQAECVRHGYMATGSNTSLRARVLLLNPAPRHRGLCDSLGHSPEHCCCGSVIDDSPNVGGYRTRICRDSGQTLGGYATTS